MEKFQIPQYELELRAEWLGKLYEVDKERVQQALAKSVAEIAYELVDDSFTSYKFSPSLEKAFTFFKPEVAIRLFTECEVSVVKSILAQLEATNCAIGRGMDMEVLLRWDMEVDRFGFDVMIEEK